LLLILLLAVSCLLFAWSALGLKREKKELMELMEVEDRSTNNSLAHSGPGPCRRHATGDRKTSEADEDGMDHALPLPDKAMEACTTDM
jgi:hypothetical protein